jgi:hypothetical protein
MGRMPTTACEFFRCNSRCLGRILGLAPTEIDMALEKKKRERKKTIPASQVTKTRSGAKRRKSDGAQRLQTPVMP